MKVPDEIKLAVKNTVGYNECANKGSFMVGSSVAFSKSEDFYAERIKSLETQLKYYESAYNTVVGDFKALAALINKYQPNE